MLPDLQQMEMNLGYKSTPDQKSAINKLVAFLDKNAGKEVFILRGYAGTGKTTLVKAIVKSLRAFGMTFQLMAPTGRAAKVLSSYSGKSAFTIHRSIYRQKQSKAGFSSFVLKENNRKRCLYIIDEASMISDERGLSGESLLSDLFRFVRNGEANKILFLGDLAQLPPVGSILSTALNPQRLTTNYSTRVDFCDLRDVVRQEVDSGVLYNATKLRQQLAKKDYQPRIQVSHLADVAAINPYDVQDALEDSFSDNDDRSIFLTRSNKRANLYNQEIRKRILWREEDLEAGDRLMVVKNNYFWAGKEDLPDFIANGDMVEIRKIGRREKLYELTFADVDLVLKDYEGEKVFNAKIILDTLNLDGPSLPDARYKMLMEEVMMDHGAISKKDRADLMKEDPYINALQVKFAYAVTCHKAQGGQWDNVFIDQGYLTEEMLNQELLRWLYTALTRAKEKVYLVNFKKEFIL